MAVATADIHIKIDPQVKSEAEENFKKCGTTMSRFINDVLRSFNHDFKQNSREIEGYVIPENLRIESRKQLINILEKRISSDNGIYYTIEEAKEKISGGRARGHR